MRMQFKENTPVYTADGEEVGTIDRVVIEPESKEVTHVVVRQGWLFTEDKVLATDLIEQATADQVRLRADVEHLDELPQFEETHYLPYEDSYGTDLHGSATTAATPSTDVGGYARSFYAYPPVGAAWPGYYGAYGYPMGYAAGAATAQPYRVQTERNIPEGTVALKEGSSVVDNRGQQVGSVARVFLDEQNQQATHLLVSKGWLFKEKRVVPINWLNNVSDDQVELKVNADFVRRLPEYRE